MIADFALLLLQDTRCIKTSQEIIPIIIQRNKPLCLALFKKLAILPGVIVRKKQFSLPLEATLKLKCHISPASPNVF